MNYAEILAAVNTPDTNGYSFDLAMVESPNHAKVPLLHDNIALDMLGQRADDASFPKLTTRDIKTMYDAAKVMFARHPGANFMFDAMSAWSAFGSPWGFNCETPEEWVLVWARRYAETDECAINGTELKTISALSDTYLRLEGAGVPTEFLDDNLFTLCYACVPDPAYPCEDDADGIIRVKLVSEMLEKVNARMLELFEMSAKL